MKHTCPNYTRALSPASISFERANVVPRHNTNRKWNKDVLKTERGPVEKARAPQWRFDAGDRVKLNGSTGTVKQREPLTGYYLVQWDCGRLLPASDEFLKAEEAAQERVS